MTRVAGITISKCMKTGRLFGIRWEKTDDNIWEATWSFKIPASQQDKAKNTSESNVLSGQFHFPPSYPGCPHCHGRINLKCARCGGLYCHDIDKGYRSVCPWCGLDGQLGGGGGPSSIQIKGRQDR